MLERYSANRGSFFMVDRRALSTDFWSLARALATFFFCCAHTHTAVSFWFPFFPTRQTLIPGTATEERWKETNLRLLPLCEKPLLSLLLLRLLPREVSLASHLLYHLLVDPLQLHLRTRGNHVSRVYPAEGHAVHFEGAGHEEDALGEVFEEDDALAAETAGEEDEDAAWLEGGAWTGGVDGFADLIGSEN